MNASDNICGLRANVPEPREAFGGSGFPGLSRGGVSPRLFGCRPRAAECATLQALREFVSGWIVVWARRVRSVRAPRRQNLSITDLSNAPRKFSGRGI